MKDRHLTVKEANKVLRHNPPAQYQGKLQDRYDIYVSCTDDKFPKSFDEWLNS
jgi:hypothetical protein